MRNTIGPGPAPAQHPPHPQGDEQTGQVRAVWLWIRPCGPLVLVSLPEMRSEVP